MQKKMPRWQAWHGKDTNDLSRKYTNSRSKANLLARCLLHGPQRKPEISGLPISWRKKTIQAHAILCPKSLWGRLMAICFDCAHFNSERQDENLLVFCELLGIEIMPSSLSCEHFKPCLGLTSGNTTGKLAFPNTVKPDNGLFCIPNAEKIIVKTKIAIIDDLSANADYYHTGKGNHVRPGDGDTPVAHSARERTRLPFSL